MKAKKPKNGIKVLISLVIALTMVSIPASVFASTGDGNNDGGAVQITADTLYGETGTPPYDPTTYGANEDNRHIEDNGWYDPYASDRGVRDIPPDVDVTYLNNPDPSKPHATAEQDVSVTVTNWDDEAHYAKIFLQVYEEVKFDPVTIWNDDMESCCVNWTAVDNDGDGVTWGRTEVRSNSPTHSWHNVQDCVTGTYVGNSNDSLISREIEIPEMCNGEKPTLIWVDFMQWLQGEISNDQDKYEDYGQVYYSVDGGDWVLLANYEDTSGEWLTSDPNNDSIEAWVPYYVNYDYDVDGNPLGFRIPFTQDNSTIRIMFQWHSDPGTQYEGWYIDDVVVRAQCGSLQELVGQYYKPVDSPEYLSAFNQSGFQKEVQFHLPFTPKDDTTYFFEAYSELIDADDVDDHYDFNGSYKVDSMTGATYWDPDNGVNESVYFGIWHDGQAEDISWDGVNTQIEMVGDSVDVPIVAHVSNQGTVTEPIPYTIEVRRTLTSTIFGEDFESGDTDYYVDQGYEVGYFSNPDCVLPHVATDMDAHSGSNAWYFGGEVCPDQNEGYYGSNMYCAFRTPEIDMSDYVGKVTTHFTYWVKYAINTSLGPSPGYTGSFDPGWADKWYFGVITQDGTYLFLSSTGTTGYSDWLQVESTNTPTLKSNWNDANPGSPWYPIEVTNPDGTGLVSWLQSIGYGDGQHIAFFWAMATDGANNNYPGVSWSGLYVDDLNLYMAGTGETVWSMDGVTEPLEPGEVSDDIEAIWHSESYCDYTPVIVTHVDDDWNTNFKGTDLAYMYNDEASGDNLYIYTEIYDEDFEASEFFVDPGEFSSEWSTDDNTFGTTDGVYWTVVSDGAPGWQENHYVWTGEEESGDSYYPTLVNEVLVPAGDDGIATFDMTDQTAVELRFDLWNEIETDFDYLTLEITNDSGDNWWTIAHWNNLTNATADMEQWMHYDMQLFNGTDYIQAWNLYEPAAPWWIPFYGGVPIPPVDWVENFSIVNVSITDEMSFRFHMFSDGGWDFKGAYIDNVELVCLTNETIPYDGTDKPWKWVADVMFEDDFENGLDKWLSIDPWTGSMWHVTDTCYYSGTHSAANFDPYPWSSYNKHLIDAAVNLSALGPSYYYYVFANGYAYDHSYGYYRNNADDKLVLDLDLSGVYQAWLKYMLNYTLNTTDVLSLEVSTDGGVTWKEITKYTTGDSGGWMNQTGTPPTGFDYNYGIDLSPYAGQPIKLRWRLVTDSSAVGEVQLDDILVTGKIDREAPETTAILGPATPDGCNGWYVSDVTVTLNAQDREMGETYYSIDGGAWLLYTGPVTIGIDGEHTISYYSVDAVGNVETTKSVSFKIDKTAPTGSITSPEAGYIYFFGRQLMPRILDKSKALIIGGLTATATASDATSGVGYVSFSTSSGGVEDAVSPYEYNLPFYFPFGSDTLTVSVTDNACNSANAGSVDYIKIL